MTPTEWPRIETHLREHGYASLGQLLQPAQCLQFRLMYQDESRFRSRIDMARYRFGRGEYQYFSDPLPPLVQELREQLYQGLAPIATAWNQDLKQPADFPALHASFLDQCAAQGQSKPTPLLLRYRQGDYNCLHQDLYGDLVFPFQVIVALSQPGVDYLGGELVLTEQLPRAQSSVHVVVPQQGEGIVIATRYRPAQGSRGIYRTNLKHGVARLHHGERYTLGIIFHNAK